MTSLTAKYRPRRFAEVAGQDAVKAILSRAAATDRVAPAYLFSGTRGVGKTTIARIFAKALNCEKAPTPEPCNECRMCRQANAGNAPDIVEIDAASHGRVDDVRALKEDVGYAPLEGRYKVFIIDEAHMLSTAAFNALLKTLEEPPQHVVFIMASTEAHKFPATILSRCQHYVFKMLSQDELVRHLEGILKKEGVEYEPGAVRIIARRGAGSVRDSISLLGQALAYATGPLKEAEVRACLGLAGQEVFFAIMRAIRDRDLPLLSRTIRQVLDQGLDLGFFLRELSGCWRNMFLLREAGEAMIPELGLPAEEAAQWMKWAADFTPTYIHACWQMTLEGQQRVIKSLEPAQALELLLLNLACLPDLLPLSALAGVPSEKIPPRGGRPQSAPASAVPASADSSSPSEGASSSASAGPRPVAPPAAEPSSPAVSGSKAVPAPSSSAARPAGRSSAAPQPEAVHVPAAASSAKPAAGPAAPVPGSAPATSVSDTPISAESAPRAVSSEDAPRRDASDEAAGGGVVPAPAVGPRTWAGFLAFVEAAVGPGRTIKLKQAVGEIAGNRLTITCCNPTICDMVKDGDRGRNLQRLAARYFGPEVEVVVTCPDTGPLKTEGAICREMQDDPVIRRVRETFECREPAVIRPRD